VNDKLFFIIGDYLAKLQARAWLCHALCTPGQHTAERRRKVHETTTLLRVTGANIQHVSYDIRSDDCSRYASNSDKTLSHCICVALGVSPALRPDTRPCLHPTAIRDPQLDADSIVSELRSLPRLRTPSGLSPSPGSGL